MLPLNSPAYCERFNGGIERGIGEIKGTLPEYLPVPPAWNLAQTSPTLAALLLQQNMQPRRRLAGLSAGQKYYGSDRRRFSKRERQEAFESIRSDMTARLKEMEDPNRRDHHAAWRQAAVHWLVCQNLISVSLNQTDVTSFF